MEDEDDWIPSDQKLERIEIDAEDDSLIKSLKKNQENLSFYNPIQDLKYEKWAENTFGKISKVLSCPKCFTSICYDSIEEKDTHRSMKTFNTKIIPDIQKSNNDEIYLPVNCEECNCNLGVYDPKSKYYYLFHVLGGNG